MIKIRHNMAAKEYYTNAKIYNASVEEHTNAVYNSIIKCTYCDSREHTIKECTIDNDIITLFDCENEPDFANMSMRMLKKLGALVGVPSSYPRLRLLLVCQRYWNGRKKQRQMAENTSCWDCKDDVSEVEKDGGVCDYNKCCPICMENTNTTTCTTPCGHTFCTDCFTKSVLRKNACPMCRGEIISNNDYYLSRPIETGLDDVIDMGPHGVSDMDPDINININNLNALPLSMENTQEWIDIIDYIAN